MMPIVRENDLLIRGKDTRLRENDTCGRSGCQVPHRLAAKSGDGIYEENTLSGLLEDGIKIRIFEAKK